jgi:hypothetical protein
MAGIAVTVKKLTIAKVSVANKIFTNPRAKRISTSYLQLRPWISQNNYKKYRPLLQEAKVHRDGYQYHAKEDPVYG